MMFVYDLFDDKKDNVAQKSDLFRQTQDPSVRNIIQTAYREFPQAKSDTEALAGHLAKQSELNAQQEKEIEQRKDIEASLRSRQDAMVKDLQDKEKRFQDFTAQVAKMDLSPPEQARAAVQIAKGQEPKVSTKTTGATGKKGQQDRTTTKSSPDLSIGNLSATPALGKDKSGKSVTAEPTKSKPEVDYEKPAYQRKGINIPEPTPINKNVNLDKVVDLDAYRDKVSNLLVNEPANDPEVRQAAESVTEAIEWARAKSNTPDDIAQANLKNIVLATLAPGKPALPMVFADGHGPTLPYPHVVALYRYLGELDKSRADTQSKVTNLLSNSRFFYEFMLNNIVGQTHLDPVPKGKPVPDNNQPELIEADIIPFPTKEKSPAEEAIELANNIIKHAHDTRVPTEQISIMKQRLFKDYGARIQQSPDGRYYITVQGDRVFLASPPHLRTKPNDPPGPDVAEAGMPASVVKSKKRYSQMTPGEFAKAHGDKSDEELRAMAWRHGYGKGSNHYVDKRNKGKSSVTEGVDEKDIINSGMPLKYIVQQLQQSGLEKDIRYFLKWAINNGSSHIEDAIELGNKAQSQNPDISYGLQRLKKYVGQGMAEGSESNVANLDAVFNEPDFDRLEHIWPALEAGDKEEALRQINHYLRKGKNRAWWGDLQALDIQIDPSDVENSLVKWSKPVDQGMAEGSDDLRDSVSEVLKTIYKGASAGENMIDYLADEFGQYYSEVEASGDQSLQNAYSYMMDNGQEAEDDPQAMAKIAKQAFFILKQGVAETLEMDPAKKKIYDQVYQILVTQATDFMYRANNQDVKKAIIKAMSFGDQISPQDLATYAYGMLKTNSFNEQGVAEDNWHAGDNAWSSEHDQWAKEDINNEAWLINDPESGHQIVPDGGFGTWNEKNIVNNLEKKFSELLDKLKGRSYQQIEYVLYKHGVIETLVRALAQYEKFMEKQGRRPIGRGREIDMSKINESLRPGEYHIATVTLDDGKTVRIPITSDEGWREPIVRYFEKQGKEVKDIQVDYGVYGNDPLGEEDFSTKAKIKASQLARANPGDPAGNFIQGGQELGIFDKPNQFGQDARAMASKMSKRYSDPVDRFHQGGKELGIFKEEDSVSAVKGAITRRIIGAHSDWISEFGIQEVINAIDSVANFVGDVEEIGTSDVSGWVKQVGRELMDNQSLREAKKKKKKMSAADDPCWKGYHMVGKKKKNGREVPNCVPGKKG